jgi:hypothetical protein
MTNRTLFSLTALVILGIAILLGLNMTSILTGEPKSQTYLKYNEVRGMAIGHNQLLYTLNFQQQNTVIEILNKAAHVLEIPPGKHQKPNIDRIVVYQFNKPDLLITPIAYMDQNFIFSVPEWIENGYLMELSDGDLHQLLSQAYDP